MKLILMRHMKSDWDGMTSDHDRPLNARGRASAPLLGAWLAAGGHLPNKVLLSDSQRTRETLAGVAPHLTPDVEVIESRLLYLAEPKELFAGLAAHRGTAECVLIIAHNPGIAELALTLVDDEPKHPKFYDYPTGATTVLDFAGAIEPHSGRLLDFAVPREL